MVVRPAARPAVVVVSTIAQRQTVEHACHVAIAAGVRSGMTLAHARAVVRGRAIVTIPHDPARDAAGLAGLARWCLRWTPVARAEPPAGVLLDITGCEHLFGGERALGESLRGSLERLGLTARIAVASTVGAAWAVARFGDAPFACVAPGQEARALAPLPVEALRINPEVVGSLREIGVETVGQALDLPRITLPGRYGSDLLLRIDQALGHAPEPVFGVVPAEAPRLALELPGGTTQWESVGEAVRRLLAGLGAALREREAGVSRLEARFTRVDGDPVSIAIELSCPTRARSHLWSLLRPRLERLHMGHGIERIELHALRVERIAHEQRGLAGIAQREGERTRDAELAQTLEVIASRIGPDRVRRFTRRQSHRPERAFSTAPALGRGVSSVPTGLLLGPRPSRLLDPPEAARVVSLCPEGPVLRLWWRGVERRVMRSIGPERIGGEWWLAREPARDYYRVQDDTGLWLWVFRSGAGGDWLVHGVWG